MTRHGQTGLREAPQARRGAAGQGAAGRGIAGEARPGEAGPGGARSGTAGIAQTATGERGKNGRNRQ